MRSTASSAPQRHAMGKALGGLVTVLFAAFSVQAQLSFTARTAFDQFLQYEPIYVELKITNQGVSDLIAGGPESNLQLALIVEQRPGFKVPALDNSLLTNPVKLAPRETTTLQIEISKGYDVRKTGPYTIFPRLLCQGKVYTSGRLLVEIVPGFVKSSHTMEGLGKEGATRTCSLRTLYRGRAQRLFFRMDDEQAELCYGVYDIGRMISHSPATLESGASGNIHVLHQSGPFRFSYNVFTSEGKPVTRKFFAKESAVPKLVFDEKGRLQVEGVREYDGDPSTLRPVRKDFEPFQ